MPEEGTGTSDTAGPSTGSPVPSATPTKTTKERAHEALAAAGLSTKPPKSDGARRVVTFAVVILVVLVVVVVGCLIALDHLQSQVTPLPTTPSTVVPPTTSPTTTTVAGAQPSGASTTATLAAYETASTDGVVLREVGNGGQPVGLERTASQNFNTDAAANPVVVYWWDGGTCAPCAAENLVVVSALEALGGTFHGLAATTESGPTATIDLRHASYHGPVLFEAAEVHGANGRVDQSAPPAATAQAAAYDAAPYTKQASALPFLDVGGRYVEIGSGFTSALLAGRSLSQVATTLSTPDDPVSRAVLGSANQLDAAVCTTLAELSRPLPTVCANPAIVSLELTLPTAAPHAG
jgi:hypothetical protein